MLSSRKDGLISYDDFIVKMDASIRHRQKAVEHNVEEALFKKVNDCLTYSGETLYDVLAATDYDEVGSILKEDLARVFKRIGLSTVEQNMPRILQIGGVTENQERVDINIFAKKFMRALKEKLKSLEFQKNMFINKIHSLLKAKQLSLFDVFIRMDSNHSGCLTKIEMKTGIQRLGIVITSLEMEMLWKSVRKAKKKTEKAEPEKKAWSSFSLAKKN